MLNATRETMSVQGYMCGSQLPRASLLLAVTRSLLHGEIIGLARWLSRLRHFAARLDGLNPIPRTHMVEDLTSTGYHLTSI